MRWGVWWYAVAVLLCLAGPGLAGNTDEGQVKVARAFLTSYFRQEWPAVRPYLPVKPANLFGPYPFTGTPALSDPRVDENQALVEFTGSTLEKDLPGKGGLLCYKQDGTWKVRQVLFYNKVPLLFGLPKKSGTAADRRQEPRVQVLAEQFLADWRQGKAGALADAWYAWANRQDDPISGLSMSGLKLSVEDTALQCPWVKYSTTMTYKWGPLGYRMSFRGRLFLVEEGNTWKVRGNVLVFDF